MFTKYHFERRKMKNLTRLKMFDNNERLKFSLLKNWFTYSLTRQQIITKQRKNYIVERDSLRTD